jgi:phosphatidate cytidylyltransferase
MAAALPAIAFAIFIVVQGGLVFAAGLIALGLICLHELYAMFDRAHPVRLAGFVALIGMLLAAHYGEPRHVLLALACAVPLTFGFAVLQPRGGAPAVAVTLLGVGWIALAFAHAVMLRDLPHGAGVIVTILVATFIGDTGAYLGGRMFGATRLAPSISPNKTLEGLVIGMLAALFGAWAAGLYQDWLTHGQALLIGLSVALMAPLGDLFESQVKRDAGTKDAGSLFGVHGGALDRLDAAFFTLIAGYYVWRAML